MTANGAGRRDLGHSESLMLKMHPDLKSWVDAQAQADYTTSAEYIRRLIIADKRAKQGAEQ